MYALAGIAWLGVELSGVEWMNGWMSLFDGSRVVACWKWIAGMGEWSMGLGMEMGGVE